MCNKIKEQTSEIETLNLKLSTAVNDVEKLDLKLEKAESEITYLNEVIKLGEKTAEENRICWESEFEDLQQ